ncbi:TIGR02444 family protein [Pseudomonas putida]|uniref:TIGR02444 family protein n=1 Tax=Pseudomonas putida TaxID=303 RepID=UPI0018E692A9|nr:TIGR02444 family protein [Pseudomonas putida]MBI6924218.1 TIGR02444 family protein [Pseudomonas putida]
MQSDLWDYALSLYARPGVEAACLDLQRQGGDVCLLLCAAWLQARSIEVQTQRVEALQGCAGPWQRDVVSPLRRLREQWREPAKGDQRLAELREQLKRLELSAERGLLERLQACASAWSAGRPGLTGDWLAWLAPSQLQDHRALEHLRAAALVHQVSVDED